MEQIDRVSFDENNYYRELKNSENTILNKLDWCSKDELQDWYNYYIAEKKIHHANIVKNYLETLNK